MINIGFENVITYLNKELEICINKGVFENKRIILFGLNSTSYSTKSFLEQRGFKISAFLDNDAERRKLANEALDYYFPKLYSGSTNLSNFRDNFLYSYSPKELLSDFKDDVAILISSKYYSQMAEQLKELGYCENKHFYKVFDFYNFDQMVDEYKELKELGNDDIKQIELKIMRKLKQICDKNGLRYYLCGGTLLGAVRHKGFIPWDDDIDVAVPMSDYKTLIRLIEEDGEYIALAPYKDTDNYNSMFMKIVDKHTIMKSMAFPFLTRIGVNIDVFPLFGLPEKKEDIKDFYYKIRSLNHRRIDEYMENMDKTEQFHYCHQEVLKMMELYDFDESSQIGYLLSKYEEKEIMPRSLYESSLQVEFEGEYFNVAYGYKDYLTRIFKNYMELPPEKERMTTHSVKAYYCE